MIIAVTELNRVMSLNSAVSAERVVTDSVIVAFTMLARAPVPLCRAALHDSSYSGECIDWRNGCY